MKKVLFSFVLLGVLTISAPATAEQSINTGTPSSDVQQSVSGDYFQKNGTNQPASNITQNAGAEVLQNTPNQRLTVVGAPADSTVSATKSDFRWVAMSLLLFAVLISPAILYARSSQPSGENQANASATNAENKDANETDTTVTVTNDATKSTSKKLPKKKSKKSTKNNPAKRRKKSKK